ncbi:MAG: hypothetical protein GY811_12890 [Myxococcales bacterium]|nr:hypothetical protein [Myxococcales bacterium]
MGADDTWEEEGPDGLEILAEPEGVASVVTPIEKSESPDAFILIDEESPEVEDATDEDPIDDLDELDKINELDIEELDELDLVEEEDDKEVERGAVAPPPMPAPPPVPPRTPLPAKTEDAKPVAEPLESAELATPPAAPETTAEAPLEFKLTKPAEVSALDALLEGRGPLDWNRRAEKLTKELAMTESKSRMGELAYELGELYQRHLGDEASAVKAYGRALQADPSLRANLWAIRRIFYRRKLWPNLVKLIGVELRFASSDRQRADLLLERGRTLLDGVGEPQAAQESFEQALALDTGNHAVLLALESLASQHGDSELLFRTLEQLAAACSRPERKVAILVELARELRLEGVDLGRAQTLLAEASSLDCLHEAVDREREALARHSDDFGALAAVLEGRIGRLQESFGVAGVPNEESAPSESGGGQRLREILALRREQAQVLTQGGDDDGAWSCLHQALSLAPQEPLLVADLSDLAESLGRYEELAELVAARESGEVDAGRALGLALRRASALAKAGKQQEADEVLESRARSTPGYLPLVVARDLGAGASGNWEQLAALQAEMAESLRLGTTFGEGADCDPEPRAAAQHYVVSGDILRYGVGNLEAATQRYLQALEVDPAAESAVDAVADLHVGAGRYVEAAEFLETHIASAESERANSIRSQQVALYLVAGNPTGELAAVSGLLETTPEDLALCGRRIELLRELGEDATLCDALMAQAERLGDPDAQARHYFEAGRLLAGTLERWSDGAECFGKCRERWPDDSLVASLELEALRKSGGWARLVSCLRARTDSCADEDVPEYGREALAALEFAEKNSEAAVELAMSLCERAPDSVALLLDVLACLDRAKGSSGVDTAVAEVLDRIAEASDGEVKRRALIRLGVANQRLGRASDAEESFRAAGEMGSAAAVVALHQAAVAQEKSVLQAEALAALGRTMVAPELRSSLGEMGAWLEAVRGNDEEAAEHFALAEEGSEAPVGSLLGQSLLAAKAQDAQGQGEFLEALADAAEGAYAQSSLLLHSAMIAEVLGDEDVATGRLQKARRISPLDAGTAVVIADRLAPLSPEGGESVSGLLERGELCDMRSVLADSGAARVDWELERAEALELAGHLQEAILAVGAVLDIRPGHIRGLQTLRRVCVRGGDRGNQAKACIALARQIGDREGRVAYFREAVEILDGELDDASSAVATYQAILAEMPEAPEYDRLVAILREHGDTRNLYRAYSARLKHLSVAGEHRARVPILLSRARLRKDIGDLRGATRDYAALLDANATHLDALYERAQLLERLGEDREAAEHLKSFLEFEAAPERRATAEMSLSHLMADSLDDLEGAIEQLEHVVRQTPNDLEVRERLLSLLVKAKRINEASCLIRGMAGMRNSDGQRARDELRIASLQREASNREAAIKSLRRARQYDPLNVEALSDLIELCGGEEKTRISLIASGVQDLRRAIADQPADPALYEKLAIVASWAENGLLERQALHALEMTGSLSSEQETSVSELGVKSLELGGVLSAEKWRSSILHRDSGGFAGQLWSIIGPAVTVLSETTPEGLGFERGQRIKRRSLAKEVPEVAKIAAYLGVDDLEVYRSDARGGVARAVSDATPTVCLGETLAVGDTPEQRFSLGRCLAHAKAGTGSATELAEADLFLYFAASAELAGVSPLPAVLADRVKAEEVSAMSRKMSKALGRKARKELTLLGSRFSELGSPVRWREGAEQSASRIGLLLCGSLKAAFDVLDVGKGGRLLADASVGRELMAWSVGEEFLAMVGVGDE